MFNHTFGIDMILNIPLRARSFLQVGTAGHFDLLPTPGQKPNFKHTLTVCTQKWIKSGEGEALPLGKRLSRGVQHTSSSFVQKANFAAQNFHQVAFPTAAHFHLPQIISVPGSILRTETTVV